MSELRLTEEEICKATGCYIATDPNLKCLFADKHTCPLFQPASLALDAQLAKLQGMKLEEVRDKWSDDWPTEPGWWWLYGWLWHPVYSEKARLHLVECYESSGVKKYTSAGYIIRKREETRGKWLKAELPELPEGGKYDNA